MYQDNPFLNILVSSDQELYFLLRESSSSERNKYQRFHRTDAFENILESVRKFCMRGDEDDWKRCMVCGICWTASCIGVNVKQLMITTGKSKSNINGVFSKLGYVVDTLNLDLKRELVDAIPFLRGNYLEQRYWTIRVNYSKTPVPQRDIIIQNSDILSATPEPTRLVLNEIPGANDVQDIFDVFKIEFEENCECGKNGHNGFDFYSDAACCCPSEWFTPNSSIVNTFTYA